MARDPFRRYYHPECYAEVKAIDPHEAFIHATKIGMADTDPEAAISVPRCAHCGKSITYQSPANTEFLPRPGRPRIYDNPRQDLHVWLPTDLLAAIDATSDNRTGFIEQAVREKLGRGGE